MAKCKDCENFVDGNWCELWEDGMEPNAKACGEFSTQESRLKIEQTLKTIEGE